MFEEVYGILQTECGYTPAEIDQMTLFDLQRLTNYWRRNPPQTVLIRYVLAALGVKLPTDKPDTSKYLTAEEFGAMVRATNGFSQNVG